MHQPVRGTARIALAPCSADQRASGLCPCRETRAAGLVEKGGLASHAAVSVFLFQPAELCFKTLNTVEKLCPWCCVIGVLGGELRAGSCRSGVEGWHASFCWVRHNRGTCHRLRCGC